MSVRLLISALLSNISHVEPSVPVLDLEPGCTITVPRTTLIRVWVLIQQQLYCLASYCLSQQALTNITTTVQ